MRNKSFTIIIVIASFVLFGFGEANRKSISVSMINLIATPDKYHGKLVRVIGVSNLEFEGYKIYLSKEHRDIGVTKNSIWISIDYDSVGKTEDKLVKYNGQYVLVEGIFDKDYKGHLDLNSGSIMNITRFMPWEESERHIKEMMLKKRPSYISIDSKDNKK